MVKEKLKLCFSEMKLFTSLVYWIPLNKIVSSAETVIQYSSMQLVDSARYKNCKTV